MRHAVTFENSQASISTSKLTLWCVLPLCAFGMLAYLLPLMIFAQGMAWEELVPAVTNRDFANYWMAGRLVLDGEQQQLFTQHIFYERLKEVFGTDYPIHNWSYPPHFLLVLWPFGLMEYKLSLIVFLTVTFALFLGAAALFRRRFAPDTPLTVPILAVASFSFMMIDTAQNGFLTAALLLAGLAWMRDRPALAGLAFALLTVKPQLGLLIPVLLLIDRNWRTIAWATGATLALAAVSAVLFGLESWQAYLTETLAYQRFVMTGWSGIFLRMMPTVFGAGRTLGLAPATAEIAQWPVSIFGGALTIWLLLRERDELRRIFALLCGTFLISPYAFNYDMGALAMAAALLAVSGRLRNQYAVIMIAVAAALPAAVMNLGRAGLPVAPILLALALVALAFEMRRGGPAHTETTGAATAT